MHPDHGKPSGLGDHLRRNRTLYMRAVRIGAEHALQHQCPIGYCAASHDWTVCEAASIPRLVKLSCQARPHTPSALVARVLSQPTLVGRAGNGEMFWLSNAVDLLSKVSLRPVEAGISRLGDRQLDRGLHVGRVRDLTRGAGHGTGHGAGLQRPHEAVRILTKGAQHQSYKDKQKFASDESDLPRALTRFLLEYSRALSALDLELLWDVQGLDMLLLRCRMHRKHTSPDLLAFSSAFAASVGGLSRVSHMIHYNVSIDYWLDVLEELARRNARVFVVTGFAESITHQITRLHLIHPTRNLTGLTFRILATPMQFPLFGTPRWPLPKDSHEQNYAANLDRLTSSTEWDPSKSDVALLGCGPLGLPLAHHAKKRGVSAIYLGGVIQLLFGLIGRRYVKVISGSGRAVGGLSRKVFGTNVLNRHWRPPLRSETPPNFYEQEGGAYWR